jgi:chromate transporter
MTPIAFTDLAALFGQLILMSPLAVGGALAVLPDLHRVMVTDMGLLTDEQFTASIAITQASPGPNVLFVAVMGYQAAGLVGAAVTLLGILLPSTTLACVAANWGSARRDWRIIRAFKTGMAPIVIALMLATGWILNAQAPSWGHLVIALTAALLMWRARIHVLALIAAGALAGAAGWI